MRISEISVTFERRVSDGDYGSERVEIRTTAVLDSGDNPADVLRSLLIDARANAQADLLASSNSTVRYKAAAQHAYCEHCGGLLADGEHDLHAICRDLVEEEEMRQHAVVAEPQAAPV